MEVAGGMSGTVAGATAACLAIGIGLAAVFVALAWVLQ